MKPVKVSTVEEIKKELMDPDATVEMMIEESSGYTFAPDITIKYLKPIQKTDQEES